MLKLTDKVAVQETLWEAIAEIQMRHDSGLDQDSNSKPGFDFKKWWEMPENGIHIKER